MRQVHQPQHKSESFIRYFNLGVDRRKAGDMQGAIEAWTQALRIDPKDTHAYYDRGVTKADVGNYKEAIEDLNQVIRLNPKYSNAYLQRDKIYQFYNIAQNELKIDNRTPLNVDTYRRHPNYFSPQNQIILTQPEDEHDDDYELNDCYTHKDNEYHDLILEGEEYSESFISSGEGWFYSDDNYDEYESFIRWNG